MKENIIQSACQDILKKLGIEYYHLPAKAAVYSTTFKGFPDLLFFFNGKAYAVELKADGGRLSDIQKKTIENLGKRGVKTAVCFSVRDFLLFLGDTGIVK
jgi:hypothetical protein